VTVADDKNEAVADEQADAVLRAARALVGIAVASVEATDHGLTLTQFRGLVLICQGTTLGADLAVRLAVNPSSVSRLCDALVNDGMLKRARNPLNQREVLLAPTAKGQRLVAETFERRRAMVRDVLSRIEDPARREAVGLALAEFAAASELVDRPVASESVWWPAS
jgi:DNA-binding MarR family transcriptional regulator